MLCRSEFNRRKNHVEVMLICLNASSFFSHVPWHDGVVIRALETPTIQAIESLITTLFNMRNNGR
ncbi:hypothetical protein E2C01_014621 [Portunus trituberculatus]|uniref:Uncharacterized protein n=1 Tax=Portunus trituberculatus TaxID=210409 RepID=A0A5B7DJN6_PORTR|nr:hypothetical protein [Portunus trituberculatus]